jgi:hypothetical protein
MDSNNEDSRYLCNFCYGGYVPLARWKLGYTTCLPCGEAKARARKHCVVPMNKSNYMLVTDSTILKQLNPKRTT